ncbi:hypothetical protein EZJ43_02170 [Pedobacter changchengzhani]|uniref:Uncharacterized protein n=1 Tax=Pedobacter changchengzhani TaxID=2529274 RepID=A0A4R5MQB3_9SPHI|nr:hypothetical protein [Pedobacter changchengzhani]TDG37918.1 hypothetical protein EZJ43_02170 [Pedobacter changchengzhani]
MEVPKPILINLKENISENLQIMNNSFLAEKRRITHLKELCVKCEYYEMVAKLRDVDKMIDELIGVISK